MRASAKKSSSQLQQTFSAVQLTKTQAIHSRTCDCCAFAYRRFVTSLQAENPKQSVALFDFPSASSSSSAASRACHDAAAKAATYGRVSFLLTLNLQHSHSYIYSVRRSTSLHPSSVRPSLPSPTAEVHYVR